MLFISLMFPVSIWFFTDYLVKGAFEGYYTYIYAATAGMSLLIILIAVIPSLTKKRKLKICINEKRIKVFFTDYQDYELPVNQIVKIRTVRRAQDTMMQEFFLIDKQGTSHQVPHYLDVPMQKVIKTLIYINPQIERVGDVRY